MANFDRIVGGQEAAGPIPWQVSVRELTASGWSRPCGGTILDSKTVVTAAHCRMDYINGYVMAGKVGWATGMEDNYKIAQVIRHPEYKRFTLHNDIAILKLSDPLTMSEAIEPMCLPDADYVPASGKKCYVSGWGMVQGSKLEHKF